MAQTGAAGSFVLGSHAVHRMGYGAMHLAGPGVFGPPSDHDAALAVLREAVASGVDHIDTSDYYGPHVTNQLIREALWPYPQDLAIVTKVGAARRDDGSVRSATTPPDLTQAVHDNLRNLGRVTKPGAYPPLGDQPCDRRSSRGSPPHRGRRLCPKPLQSFAPRG
jgi:pyridoxine 4-dehydrogenase